MNFATIKTACSSCNLRELCLPVGLSQSELEQLDELVYVHRRCKRNTCLYCVGDRFDAIYAVRTGFFKTCLGHEDGQMQVMGFHMAGEIIGLDGINTDRYTCDAVALEDSEVCVIPYPRFEEISHQVQALQHHFSKILSREIEQDHRAMLLLGSMRAEERLAAFLLNLSQRFAARGYSANEFNLRMTREEIGSYLGLTLESVSRLFSKFHEDRLLSVRNKQIRITNPHGLQQLSGHAQGRAA
ncbi:MAG TPA: fumarate/nitrate reduction transcriptional regulator Fnr [Burkholderiales bacterium]|nr:fumarate/nitrate reduction transcriptional regulator Fnr [Burkholderiales bacterium]